MTEKKPEIFLQTQALQYKGYTGYFLIGDIQKHITIIIADKDGNIVRKWAVHDVYTAIGKFEVEVLELILKKEAEKGYFAAVSPVLESLIKKRKEYYKKNNEEAEINF